MRWQDLALTAASLTFSIALVPTLLSPVDKPALSTSVINTAVLALMAGVYFSLSLWFAASTTAVSGVLWAVIAVQTYTLRR